MTFAENVQTWDNKQMHNNTINQLWTLFSGITNLLRIFRPLGYTFHSSTNVFAIIHPPLRCPDKEKGSQNEMLICPHILPMLLLYYCQWKNQRLQKCSGRRAKKDGGRNRRRILNWTKYLLEMDAERTMIYCWSALIMRMFRIFCGLVWHL